MKPAPFAYHAPATREEALALLAASDGEAKPLAGGQSLVPSMNFRLAQPAILVDLNGVADLFGIHETAEGGLRIGAMTRQRVVERNALVAARAPLLAEALPHVAHPQIRNRGTLGGSLVHADPAAELPAVAVALGATFEAQSSTGTRTIPAGDFFLDLFTTTLEPDELLVEIHLPPLPSRTGTAFAEFARRHGDFALAGVAAVVTLAADGTVEDGRVVLFALGGAPIMAAGPGAALLGIQPSPDAIRAAAEAVLEEIDPTADIHATVAYRRHLARVLTGRALRAAVARAQASSTNQ